jgi:hypothetical protein
MFGAPKAPPPPATRAPQPVADGPAPESARGRSVALLGLPSSGKTSYLYALTHTSARGRHRWVIGLHTKEFERLTGDANERQEGTPVGEFRPARLFGMSRPWLGALGMRRGPGHARDLVIPEIAGETVERYALGRELKDAERAAVGKLKDYLHHSDEVLFLVGIDGTQGAAGGRLRPESVEASMLGAVKALRTILKDMQDGRDRGEPIFVSLLVTKRDRLRGTPMDRVRLRSAESSLARLARRPGRRWLASEGLVSDGGEEVTFSVNDVCGHLRARHDLDVQEAAAADFLRCHAPRAAADLAELAAQPGISLRLLAIAPYGTPSLDASGAAVFPQLTKITPSLVFESLEDLVERRFRRHARTRIAWATSALAAVLVMAVALGPVWTWHFRGKAADAANRQAWQEAASALRQAGVMPWWRVEVAVRNRATEDAELIGRVLDEVEDGSRGNELASLCDELRGMLDEVDPVGAEERRLGSMQAGASVIVDHVFDGSGQNLPGSPKLDSSSVQKIIGALEERWSQRGQGTQPVPKTVSERCDELIKKLDDGEIQFVQASSDAKARMKSALERAKKRWEFLESFKKRSAQSRSSDESLKLNAAKVGAFQELSDISKPTNDPQRRKDALPSVALQQEWLRQLADWNEIASRLESPEGRDITATLSQLAELPPWAFGSESDVRLEAVKKWEGIVGRFENIAKGAALNGIGNAEVIEGINRDLPSSSLPRAIEVLTPSGVLKSVNLESCAQLQRKRLSTSLDAIEDAIDKIQVQRSQQKLRGDSKKSRERLGISDPLRTLEETLGQFKAGDGATVDDATRAFDEALSADNIDRTRERLVLPRNSELVKAIAAFAASEPKKACTHFFDKLSGGTKPTEAEQPRTAVEHVLEKVDWGSMLGSDDRKKIKLLARAGVPDQARDRDVRKEFLGTLINDSVDRLSEGSGVDDAGVRALLRRVLALGDAYEQVGKVQDVAEAADAPGDARTLPDALVKRVVKEFEESENIRKCAWMIALTKLDEANCDQVVLVRHHLRLIEEFDLLPVRDGQKVVCYLGKRELTRELLGIDGESSPGSAPVYRLSLRAEQVKEKLKGSSPLRLPTLEEWKLLNGDGNKDRFQGLGTDSVREWLDGEEEPVGESFASVKRPPSDPDFLSDVGARAALDAVPKDLVRGGRPNGGDHR